MQVCDLSRLSQQVRDDCLDDAVKIYFRNKNSENLKLVEDVIIVLRPSRKIRETKMLNAISDGSVELVDIFLKSGLDPNFSDSKAFKLAVLRGQDKIVRLLLENGADINKCDSELIAHNITRGRIRVIEVLKEYGAKI